MGNYETRVSGSLPPRTGEPSNAPACGGIGRCVGSMRQRVLQALARQNDYAELWIRWAAIAARMRASFLVTIPKPPHPAHFIRHLLPKEKALGTPLPNKTSKLTQREATEGASASVYNPQRRRVRREAQIRRCLWQMKADAVPMRQRVLQAPAKQNDYAEL